MTIIQTPSGMVETDNPNTRSPACAEIEVGVDFQGNKPISTPTTADNTKISNPGN